MHQFYHISREKGIEEGGKVITYKPHLDDFCHFFGK